MSIDRVTVYAASSQALHPDYISAATRLGEILASHGHKVIFGGGGHGLMGAMAEGALSQGGEVHGVMPEFLTEIEQGHPGLTSLEIVHDMRTRKARMLENSDAVIALPGGCGTFEELFEVMTLKRLGQYLGPIILVNTLGYYNELLSFLRHSVSEHFMSTTHLDMWQSVDTPEEIPQALGDAPRWSANALHESAAIRVKNKS